MTTPSIFIFLFNLDVKYGLLNVLNGHFLLKGLKQDQLPWRSDCQTVSIFGVSADLSHPPCAHCRYRDKRKNPEDNKVINYDRPIIMKNVNQHATQWKTECAGEV